MFYETFGKKDSSVSINGVSTPPLSFLLDLIDWDTLANGIPGRFHGDFHFENILYQESTSNFVFIYWRQDVGGNLAVGDIYYDWPSFFMD